MKTTAAGPRSSSRRRAAGLVCILDVRMAPKHDPMPLSNGNRKAINNEPDIALAMTGILSAQSTEARVKGEALIRTADRLPNECWNERMWDD